MLEIDAQAINELKVVMSERPGTVFTPSDHIVLFGQNLQVNSHIMVSRTGEEAPQVQDVLDDPTVSPQAIMVLPLLSREAGVGVLTTFLSHMSSLLDQGKLPRAIIFPQEVTVHSRISNVPPIFVRPKRCVAFGQRLAELGLQIPIYQLGVGQVFPAKNQ